MHILTTLILLGLIGVILMAVLARLVRFSSGRQKAATITSQYQAIPTLLTPAERSFFGVLQQTVAHEYQIFAKVRLADVVKPVRNPSRSGWQSAFNRIAGKHVDFVLCDPPSLKFVAVIELDDQTHARFERGTRDGFVDSVLSDARIPILRVPASSSYSPAQIREHLAQAISKQISQYENRT
jgi:hypothetical protein